MSKESSKQKTAISIESGLEQIIVERCVIQCLTCPGDPSATGCLGVRHHRKNCVRVKSLGSISRKLQGYWVLGSSVSVDQILFLRNCTITLNKFLFSWIKLQPTCGYRPLLQKEMKSSLLSIHRRATVSLDSFLAALKVLQFKELLLPFRHPKELQGEEHCYSERQPSGY